MPSLLDAWDACCQWGAMSLQGLIKPEDDASYSEANELGARMADAIVFRGLGIGGHILVHGPQASARTAWRRYLRPCKVGSSDLVGSAGRLVNGSGPFRACGAKQDRPTDANPSAHLPTSLRDTPDGLDNFSLHIDGLAKIMQGQRRSIVLEAWTPM